MSARNRREYVELLVEYVLTGAVARQFDPFKEGFLLMFDPDGLLKLLTPRELEVYPGPSISLSPSLTESLGIFPSLYLSLSLPLPRPLPL